MSCSPASSIAPVTGVGPTASANCSSLTGCTVNVYVPVPPSKNRPSTSSVYVPVRGSVSGPTSVLVPPKSRSNTTLLNGSSSRHRALPAPLRACTSKNRSSPAVPTNLNRSVSLAGVRSPLTGSPGVSACALARSSSRKLYAPTVSPTPFTVSVYVPATSGSSPGPSTASELDNGRSLTATPAGPTSPHRRLPLVVKLSKYSRASPPSV